MGPISPIPRHQRQLRTVPDYKNLVVKAANGTVVRLGGIADVELGVRTALRGLVQPAAICCVLVVTKQADANVIDTVDRIYEMLPSSSAGFRHIQISVLSDRTTTIRASIHDMQLTLLATIRAGDAGGVPVPAAHRGDPGGGRHGALALAAPAPRCGRRFSIDNISLMALAVSVGFVVDDAIVVIENVFRNLEKLTPLACHHRGRAQHRLHVARRSAFRWSRPSRPCSSWRSGRPLSAVLADPDLRHRDLDRGVVVIDAMICAHFVKARTRARSATWLGSCRQKSSQAARWRPIAGRSLRRRAADRLSDVLVSSPPSRLTAGLYVKTPKGFFRERRTGLIFGGTRAAPDISFESMKELQQRATKVEACCCRSRGGPSRVVGRASSFNASVNNGRLFISLKPPSERGYVTSRSHQSPRRSCSTVRRRCGCSMSRREDIRGRRAAYRAHRIKFTLWTVTHLDELLSSCRALSPSAGLARADRRHHRREQNGLQANVG